ncbi:MAG: hypothetical protein F4137_08360 [Acidobacteria bacterium]|nr:hypothetical protein [Acidobacteriota bacterium]
MAEHATTGGLGPHHERGSAPRSRRTLALVAEADLDFRPLDAALLERYFDEYVAAGFLPPPRRGRWPARGASEAMDVPDRTRLEPLLRRRFADDSLVVKGVTLRAQGSEHSIVGELTSWRHRCRTTTAWTLPAGTAIGRSTS